MEKDDDNNLDLIIDKNKNNKYIILDNIKEGPTTEDPTIYIDKVKDYLAKNSDILYVAKIFVGNEDDKTKKYFKNEIIITKYISEKMHPNIINYISDGEGSIIRKNNTLENKIYLILEYAVKEDLINYIYHSQKGFGETYGKIIFKKILKGVQRIHELNVCHRDIKPDNIVFDKNFNPKIIDFGYSFHHTKENINGKFTVKIGNEKFIPPQMAENKPWSGFKADIFSLGVTLYYLVTGNYCFEKSVDKDINYQYFIKKKNYNKYWEIVDKLIEINLSDEFKNLFVKMISYKEKDRPNNIDEILNNIWFDEIEKLDKINLDKLEDNLKKEFEKRENIYNKSTKKEIKTETKEEIPNDNRDESKKKNNIFDDSIYPERINVKYLKNIDNYIKINGNLNYINFMNDLVSKIYNIKNIDIKKKDEDSLEFNVIINEEEEEEEEEAEEEDENKNEEEKDDDDDDDNDNDYIIEDNIINYEENKVIINIKLLEINDEEYILQIMRKYGSLESYYFYLEKIIEKANSLL